MSVPVPEVNSKLLFTEKVANVADELFCVHSPCAKSNDPTLIAPPRAIPADAAAGVISAGVALLPAESVNVPDSKVMPPLIVIVPAAAEPAVKMRLPEPTALIIGLKPLLLIVIVSDVLPVADKVNVLGDDQLI